MKVTMWWTALAMAGWLLCAPEASAQYASGGAGQYRSNIMWFRWGDNLTNIPQQGVSLINQVEVAGATLRVTCGLTNISGPGTDPDLRVYRPGSYFEDGLPYLYNVGGATANTMAIGLTHRTDVSSATFTFACSATLGGNPVAIDGLVFADAETTNDGEYIRTVLPAGATMRVIERHRASGCTEGYQVNRTGTTYEFRSMAPYSCYPSYPSSMGVYFLDNATQATVTFGSEGGRQAIAVGVMLNVADFGDAPDSYGVAAHLPQYSWSGGVVNEGSTNIFGGSFALATQQMPPNALLGALVDTELQSVHSNAANIDDTSARDDEDSLNVASLAPLMVGRRGLTYTVPVSCVGTAPVRAWIDFNRNLAFDTQERSAAASCVGGTANLQWTIPADITAGPSYIRIRTAANATEIESPTGVATSGEVEDHPLTILDPKVRIAKITTGNVGGPFSFSATNTTAQPGALTTVAANVAVAGSALSIVDLTAPIELVEAAPPANWSLAQIQCSNAQAGAPALSPVTNLATRKVTLPASALTAAADITCTFSNGFSRSVSLSKTWANAISGNAVGLEILNGALTTVASGASTAPVASAAISGVIAVGTQATIAETFASGSPSSYATTFVCRKINDNSVVVTSAPVVAGNRVSSTLTVPVDSDVACVVNNAGTARLTIRKSVPAGQGTGFDFTQQGIAGSAANFTLNPALTGGGSTLYADQVFSSVASGTAITINELASNSTSSYSVTGLICSNQGAGSTGSNFAYTINNSALTGAAKASASVTLVAGADVLCTFTNTRNARIVITKNTLGGDGSFVFTQAASAMGTGTALTVSPSGPHTLTTLAGAAAINTEVAAPAAGARVVITENAPPAGFFLQGVACTNLASGAALDAGTTPSLQVDLNTRQAVLQNVASGSQVNCVFSNAAYPKVTVRKRSVGGTGVFSFSGGSNGLPSALSLDTGISNPHVSVTYILSAASTAAQLTEVIPAGWSLTEIACTDLANNAVAVTSNLSTGQLLIPGPSLPAGANLICTFSNTRRTATLALAKTWVGAVVGDSANLAASGGGSPVELSSIANSSNETDSGIPVTLNTGSSVTLIESLGAANVGLYSAGNWSCTGTSGLSGTNLVIGANDTAIVCTLTNTRRQANLSVTKSNGASTVTSGASTTYTLVVANGGGAAADGAVLSDVPESGLSACQVVSCASSGGAGSCPANGTPVAAGFSHSIATFPANSSLTIGVACTVN